jgi:hypothetical protein
VLRLSALKASFRPRIGSRGPFPPQQRSKSSWILQRGEGCGRSVAPLGDNAGCPQVRAHRLTQDEILSWPINQVAGAWWFRGARSGSISRSARRRPAGGDPQAGRGHRRRPDVPDPAGRDRLGQDLHDGQRHRPLRRRPGAGPQQDAGGPAVFRVPRVLPENAVEYFVSYYDYYQPEAYVPSAICSSRRIRRSTSTSSRCACRPPRA